MNRFEELQGILDDGRYFKVVCGAGNEDPEEVYQLSMVYTLAGALGIDISANVDIVHACVKGIERAFQLAPELGIKLAAKPFINVSVGLKGDPHVRKALIIEDRCSSCGMCYENCDQEAIAETPYKIITRRCIGCGKCEEVCEFEAIEFFTKKLDFHEILPKCLAAGAENFELHAIVADDKAVMRDWEILTKILPDQFISMCLDRSELSNSHLTDRVKEAETLCRGRLIIQADGAPMSGGADTFNTTLQAVACADIIQKSKVPAKILLSGGTNSKTGELARFCDLAVHGVSIGTYARNLIKSELKVELFDTNIDAIKKAVSKAKNLVDINLDPIRRK